MLGLEDLEIGLLVWAAEDPRETLEQMKRFRLRAGQLGVGGELRLEGAAEKWDRALTDAQCVMITAVCAYEGESYTDVSTVQRTVGLVPQSTRKERIARTKSAADFAADLAIDSVACHIGFVPHDRTSAAYSGVRDVAREICDYCGERGESFALETGQEPAKIMLQFIEDVDRPNLKINFDPANMILYGTGDPIEALDVLAAHVISVHCKDGDWPPRDQPETLGTERPLGEGSVDVGKFIAKLKEIGYKNALCIEREGEPDPRKREEDIRRAIVLLRPLRHDTSSART
ncbi:MAG: sugar phosphate isomerase/epimerase family protein [Bryobacteraceae bacterium]